MALILGHFVTFSAVSLLQDYRSQKGLCGSLLSTPGIMFPQGMIFDTFKEHAGKCKTSQPQNKIMVIHLIISNEEAGLETCCLRFLYPHV